MVSWLKEENLHREISSLDLHFHSAMTQNSRWSGFDIDFMIHTTHACEMEVAFNQSHVLVKLTIVTLKWWRLEQLFNEIMSWICIYQGQSPVWRARSWSQEGLPFEGSFTTLDNISYASIKLKVFLSFPHFPFCFFSFGLWYKS